MDFKMAFVVFVVYLFLWRQGCAQQYFDLYTPGELERFKKHALENDEHISSPSSSNSQNQSELFVDNSGLVGHSVTTTPIKHSPLLLFVPVAVAVIIATIVCIVYVLQRRKRTLLRNEFTMTSEDAELSSSALGNDPFRSVSRHGELDRDMSHLPPDISVTSPAGSTTQLYER